MVNILTLNFENSMWSGNSLSDELLPRFALSFQLAIMALIITIIVALPLGMLSALRKIHGLIIASELFRLPGLQPHHFG